MSFMVIDITGDKLLVDDLRGMYPAMANFGVEAAAHFLSDWLNGYVQSAPYNYVSWAMVDGFVSDAQRAFVMAMINSGEIEIPYTRVNLTPYHVDGVGSNSLVASSEKSMYFSMDDQGQTFMQKMRGWETVSQILNDNEAAIRDAFELGALEGLKWLGLV